MDDPETYTIVGRLAVAAFVMVAPTLLFLGLIRGLERLRDDDLVNEWARTQGHTRDIAADDAVLAVLADGIGLEPEHPSTVRCPACGVSNRIDVSYCQECLNRLSS